ISQKLLAGTEVDAEGTNWDEARRRGIDVEAVPDLVRAIRPVQDLRAVWWLTHWLRRWRPDVVHTHSSKAGIVARLAARLAGVPSVVHSVHGWSFNDESSPRMRSLAIVLERLGASLTDTFITVSRV